MLVLVCGVECKKGCDGDVVKTFELDVPAEICTIRGPVHLPVLSQEERNSTRLWGARRIVLQLAWSPTTRGGVSGAGIDEEGRLGLQQAATPETDHDDQQPRLSFF